MNLLNAINAYNDGNVTLRALRAVPGFITPQAENGFYQDYVGVHAHQLAEWSAPAETMPEAIAALAVIAEDVDETLEGLPMETAIFKAAFAYLTAFNHSGAAPVLEALFREWAAAGDTPDLPSYEALQQRILAHVQTTARELAIMLYVETDGGLSAPRDEFMAMVFGLCGKEKRNAA